MANVGIYDRWHKTHPRETDTACKCSRGKNKLYPSSEHEKGHRWQVRYDDDQGKPVRRNRPELKGDDPEIHAEALAAQVKNDLATDSYVDPTAGQVTLAAFTRVWRDGQVADAATLIKLDGFLTHWVYAARIAEMPMATLAKKPSLIRSWVSWMNEKLEPVTVRWAAATLSSIFIAAMDDGVVSKNPVRARSVKLPPLVKDEVEPLTRAQTLTIRETLPERFRAMVDMGVGCGLRQGELLGLAVADLDFLRGNVKVQRQVKILGSQMVFALPKGDKVRTVPMSRHVVEALAAHLKDFPAIDVTLPWEEPTGSATTAALVFSWKGARRSGAVNRSAINHLWRAARAAAGLTPVRKHGMHMMRHTFASASLAAGVDLKRVSVDLGHADVAITSRIYAHLMPDGESRVRSAIDAFFAGSEGGNALEMPSGVPGPGEAGQLVVVSDRVSAQLSIVSGVSAGG